MASTDPRTATEAQWGDLASRVKQKAKITMTDTDPGEGSPLADGEFIAVYGSAAQVQTADIANEAVTSDKMGFMKYVPITSSTFTLPGGYRYYRLSIWFSSPSGGYINMLVTGGSYSYCRRMYLWRDNATETWEAKEFNDVSNGFFLMGSGAALNGIATDTVFEGTMIRSDDGTLLEGTGTFHHGGSLCSGLTTSEVHLLNHTMNTDIIVSLFRDNGGTFSTVLGGIECYK